MSGFFCVGRISGNYNRPCTIQLLETICLLVIDHQRKKKRCAADGKSPTGALVPQQKMLSGLICF